MAKQPKWQFLREKRDAEGNRLYPDSPWTKLTDSDKPSFAQAVMDAKARFSDVSQQGLLAIYDMLDRKKDAMSRAWDEAQAETEALAQLLRDRFEAQGIRSLNTASGSTVYTQMEPRVKVVDRDRTREWCEADEGRRHIVQPQPQSLSAWVKEALEEGRDDEIPEGIIEIELVTSLRTRKSQ